LEVYVRGDRGGGFKKKGDAEKRGVVKKGTRRSSKKEYEKKEKLDKKGS